MKLSGDDILKFRAIWISDIHLGTRGSQAELLLNFLRQTESKYLYLVGDIVDNWRLKNTWYWPQAHNDVIQKILRKARKGTRVVYVPGNHDENFRDFCNHRFGMVAVLKEAVHRTADGRKFLVLHGDGRVDHFIGGYSNYAERRAEQEREKARAKAEEQSQKRAEGKTQAQSGKKGLTYAEQKELNGLLPLVEKAGQRVEKLQAELAHLERRLDKRAQAEERKKWRSLSRFARDAARAKGRR